MSDLVNEVVLVTGGASGLGMAIVERMLDEGASVAVMDNSESAVAQLAEHVATLQAADRVFSVVGDVRSYADNEAAVHGCIEKFGKLDCAIGNAGIWDFSIALVDLPAENLDAAFDELFHVNVKGYLNLAKAALTPLVKSRGSLLYTVSNAGFYPDGGGPLYTATKHAVVGLIKQLAYELGPYVRVNGVAPGAISTNLHGPAALGQQDRKIPGDKISKTIPHAIPVGVMPSPAQYAGAYAFFASRKDNVPATGAILNHDGGFGVRGIGTSRGGDDLPSKLGLD
jgi:cis-2,3-dihydrobiphenyl-2,3-diol dehydrogenase